MNTLLVFARNETPAYFLTYILPFAIIGIVLLVFRKNQKTINKHLMLILGLIITLVGNTGNFSGAIFIVYAIHLDPGRNKTIVKLGLLIIAITCKSLFMEIHTVQIVSLLFINMLCYGYYYALFTEKKVITITEIEDQTEQIIQYIRDGKTRPEIAELTCLTPAAISKRLHRFKSKNGFQTVEQMFLYMDKNGHMKKQIDRYKNVC
jgi:hypothetical protein